MFCLRFCFDSLCSCLKFDINLSFVAFWRSLDISIALGDGDGDSKMPMSLETMPFRGDSFLNGLSLRAGVGFRKPRRLSARAEWLGVTSSRRWALASSGNAERVLLGLPFLF